MDSKGLRLPKQFKNAKKSISFDSGFVDFEDAG